MRQQYKNIFALLLLIAGFVIFSHSVIPHDHHYDTSCDTEHHEHNENEHDSPMHCHFLNDIVFDEVVLSFSHIIIKDSPTLYILSFNELIIDESLECSSLLFINKGSLPDYIVHLEHKPTRGSPLQLV